jgi:hypothetical protein
LAAWRKEEVSGRISTIINKIKMGLVMKLEEVWSDYVEKIGPEK